MLIATTFWTRLVYSAANFLCGAALCFIMSEYKRSKKLVLSLLFLAALVGGLIFATLGDALHVEEHAWVEIICWIIAAFPIAGTQLLLDNDYFVRTLMVIGTQMNVVSLNITSMVYFSTHVFEHDFISSLCFGTGVYIVIGTCYYFLARKVYIRVKHKTNPRMPQWKLLAAVPVIFLLLQGVILTVAEVRVSIYYFSMILTIAVAMLAVYFIMFYTFFIFERMKRASEQAAALSMQNALWTQQVEQYKVTVENTRKARHDIRHHDAVLSMLLESESYDEAKEYLNRHMRSIEKLSPVSFCRHTGVNAILYAFFESAKSNGIEPNIKAVVPEDIGFDIVDLCGVIFNLSENALNACKKIEEGDKSIDISITYKTNQLKVSVVNTCAEEVMLVDGHPVRKNDVTGGVGTHSVISIVEKYNGIIKYTNEGNLFKAQAVLFDTVP